MPWYVVEEDEQVLKTNYYFVHADSKQEAIDKTEDMDPDRTKTFDGNIVTYDDTHIASIAEHNRYGEAETEDE